MNVDRLILFLLAAALASAQDSSDPVRNRMEISIERQRQAIEKQRESIRRQAGSATEVQAGFFTAPWPAPPAFAAIAKGGAPGDCDPMPSKDLNALIEKEAGAKSISPDLVRAVIGKESAGKPCAISPKGAQGLMQLMPSTANDLGVQDALDPAQNVEAGTRLLKRLLDKYNGDVALALGAYNAGPGLVDREGRVPQIPETLNYVSDILGRLRIE